MPKRKNSYHHGDLKKALIDASLDLIGEKGPDAITLREVARRASVSHTAPYRHFRDKAALLAAVAEEGFLRLGDAIGRSTKKSASPADALRRAGLEYVRFAMKFPAHYRVMFGAPADLPASQGSFGGLVEIIRACGLKGDERVHARTAWAVVHGVADLALSGHFKKEKPMNVAEAAVDTIVRGLR